MIIKSHIPRKRFGQHFLHDESVLERLVRAIVLQPNDHVVEIGPGLGALTQFLLPYVRQLEVVELDRDLIPALESLQKQKPFVIHQADALKFDFAALVKGSQKKIRVVGNLPYNISTPLLFHLFAQRAAVQDMHFMLQKEVVMRLVAKVGEKNYGRLSVMTQYYCETQHLFNVGKGAFNPPPKVESAIVRLTPHSVIPLSAINEAHFAMIVRDAFNQRRKTLQNSLKHFIGPADLEKLGIDPMIRPEQVSIKDYIRISNFLEKSASVE